MIHTIFLKGQSTTEKYFKFLPTKQGTDRERHTHDRWDDNKNNKK